MQLNAKQVEGMVQRSTEWHAARRGKLSGSTIAAILGGSRYKNKDSLLREMVQESRGVAPERIENEDMKRGVDWEDAIRDAGVQKMFGVGGLALVSQTESFWSDDDAQVCYSPDGLLEIHDHRYLIEVKAPRKLSNAGSIPRWHYPQVALGMEMLKCDRSLYIEGLVKEGELKDVRCECTQYDSEWWPMVVPHVLKFQEEFRKSLSDETDADTLDELN